MYTHTPETDLFASEDAFLLTVDLPGVSESEIDITVEAHTLVLRAGGGEDALTRWYRRFGLPRAVDVGEITATHSDGVLQLHIPRHAQNTRKIPVQAETSL
jgi:HSP20 family protein